MASVNLTINVGERKTITFNTKDKYNKEDIVFNIEAEGNIEINPTANATEISSIDKWFDANINNYIIPKDLMYNVLANNIPMTQLLAPLKGASCTLTAYNLDFKAEGLDIKILISNLIKKGGYEVYVENDIDSITTSSICTLKFKIDGNRIIIECYRKFN